MGGEEWIAKYIYCSFMDEGSLRGCTHLRSQLLCGVFACTCEVRVKLRWVPFFFKLPSFPLVRDACLQHCACEAADHMAARSAA